MAYAAQRARDNGIAVQTRDVQIDGEAICGSTSGALEVSIMRHFDSPVNDCCLSPELLRALPACPSYGQRQSAHCQ